MLFTDLVGSTALRQSMGDDRADALRRQHDRVLREAITAHGGNEVKGTGDGLMVVFGSSADAVSAAVDMQRGVARYNRRAPAPIELRIGISAGDVLWEDGDCFGTPVVEARRLCDAADGGQILTGEVVRLLAGSRGGHSFTPAGDLELKGITDPLSASVVGWDADAASLPLPGPLTPHDTVAFVGRAAELHRLELAWKEAAAGVPRVVLVSGEPGVGKTRLVAEVSRAAHRAGATVLFGRCDEDLSVPYQPFVEALDGYVAHAPPDRLLEQAGRHGGDLARLLPRLAEKVPDLPEAMRAEPEIERHHLFEAVRTFIEALAVDSPLVLVIDDLHWAAKPTLLMLRHVVRSEENRSVLILATYRDTDLGRGHPLAGVLSDLRREPGVERVDLQGLNADEVSEVIVQAAGHDLDDETQALADQLYAETEGNPFFLGQTLRHLVETRAIIQENGRWRRGPEADRVGIPEGVREVIGRRLSRLSDATNDVLSTAAVIGREFDADLLVATSTLDAEEVFDALEIGEQARLVQTVPNRRGRYTFVHALVRSTLYEEISTTRRLRVHRRVGLALEERNVDDRYVDELARHFTEATALGEAERALTYGRRAAARAIERTAYEEAVAIYGLLLAAVDPDDTDLRLRADLHLEQGNAYWSCGDRASGYVAFSASTDLARRAGDPELFARGAIARGGRRAWTDAGVIDEILIGELEEVRQILPPDDSPLRAMATARLASELYFIVGEHERRQALIDEALAMARRVDDKVALAFVLTCAQFGLWVPGNEDKRLAIAEELVALGQELGDLEMLSNGWGWLFTNYWEHGDAARARESAVQLSDCAARLRMPDSDWMAGVMEACIALFEGRIDDAQCVMDRTLAVGEKAQTATALQMYGVQLFAVSRVRGGLEELEPMFLAMVDEYPSVPAWRCGVVYLYAELGWVDKAREHFDVLAETDFELPFDSNWGVSMAILCFAAAQLGHDDGAAALYDRMVPYADMIITVGMPAEVIGPCHLPLAMTAATLGRWDEAERHAESALAWLDDAGGRMWATRTRYELAKVLRERGGADDLARAATLLAEARAASEELGFPRLIERIEDLERA